MGLREFGDFSEKSPPIHILFHSLTGFQKVIGGKGREERSTEALPGHGDMGRGQPWAEKLDMKAERNVFPLVTDSSLYFAQRC